MSRLLACILGNDLFGVSHRTRSPDRSSPTVCADERDSSAKERPRNDRGVGVWPTACVPFYCFQEETLNIKRLWIAQWQEILGASDGLAYAAQEFLKVGVAFYKIDIVGVDH